MNKKGQEGTRRDNKGQEGKRTEEKENEGSIEQTNKRIFYPSCFVAATRSNPVMSNPKENTDSLMTGGGPVPSGSTPSWRAMDGGQDAFWEYYRKEIRKSLETLKNLTAFKSSKIKSSVSSKLFYEQLNFQIIKYLGL